jgi:hypothetical protein
VGDQYIHPSATSRVSIQSFWFWVGLGFGVKKPPQREREREKEAKLHLLQTPLYSLFKFDTLLSTHNEVFLFWFFFFLVGCRESQNSLSLTLSLSLPLSLLGSPTLSSSILRISLSYFYAFRGSVIFSLSVVHFQICSVFCSSVSICFSFDFNAENRKYSGNYSSGYLWVLPLCLLNAKKLGFSWFHQLFSSLHYLKKQNR